MAAGEARRLGVPLPERQRAPATARGQTLVSAYLPRAAGGYQGPREDTYINGILHRLGRDAFLPYHVAAHILRHGFIRLCKTRGVPLEVAARLAGHANIQLTAML